MKKQLSKICVFVMALVLIAAMTMALTACGGSNKAASGGSSAPAENPAQAEEAPAEDFTATYEYDGAFGPETAQFIFKADGTAEFSLPGNDMLTDIYAGKYTKDGDAYQITGLSNVDSSSEYTKPGLWDWIDADGNCEVSVSGTAFTPLSVGANTTLVGGELPPLPEGADGELPPLPEGATPPAQ